MSKQINRQHPFILLVAFCLALIPAMAWADAEYAVEINKGKLIRLGQPATSVVIADDAIADVQVVSPSLLYVNGRAVGETSILAVDNNDGVILEATITVTHNLTKLQKALEETMQETKVNFTSTDNGIVLKGDVASPYVAERVQKLASSFLKTDQGVVNMLNTNQSDQVMLMVKVAEVSRTELKRFGINLESLLSTGNFVFGLASGRDIISAATGLITRNANDNSLFGGIQTGSVDINGIIDALEDDGLITILAEPNLTTKSGVTANFLAGGEFPIPVSEEDNKVTIKFRPFGVSLDFTPTVLSKKKISLSVSPEVSSLSSVNAIMTNGFQIPSIVTRRASTTVELGSGESFAIAGLLRRDNANSVDKVPGLGELPVLGALFRSTEYRQEQTELVIIVTPYLVKGVSDTELATPLDKYTPATDLERLMLGKLYHEEPFDDKQEGIEEQVSQFRVNKPRLHGPNGFLMR